MLFVYILLIFHNLFFKVFLPREVLKEAADQKKGKSGKDSSDFLESHFHAPEISLYYQSLSG